MEVDVGLDTLRLPFVDQRQLHRAAARLGYGRIWTAGGQDPFQVCALRWSDSLDVVPGGVGTAIGVATVQSRTPVAFASSAAMLTSLTGGRFVLGIGSGSVYSREYRRTWGIEERSSLALVRAYLTTVRSFLAGENVTFAGCGIAYRDARLAGEPAPTPLYIGALGAEMVRLGGEAADGLVLSWSTSEGIAWVKERVAEGAARANRDPREVKIATNVRVCIDDDLAAARRGLAGALFSYLVPTPGSTAPLVYRPHIDRSGFGAPLQKLDRLLEQGLDRDRIIEEFPDELLRGLGYCGPAEGAIEALRRHAGSADTVIVRVVPSRPDAASTLRVMEACQPSMVEE